MLKQVALIDKIIHKDENYLDGKVENENEDGDS